MKKVLIRSKDILTVQQKIRKQKFWPAAKQINQKDILFIQRLLKPRDPDYVTLKEEIFGPVLTIYVYDENQI